MDTYSGTVLELVDWLANRSGAILMLSATLPLVLLLKEGRLLGFRALAVFLGAVTLILFGIESLAGALIVVLANGLLVSTALLSTRKRLTQIDDRLASIMSTLEKLEVAEERRQTYSARQSSISRLHPRRKPAAGTVDQIVSAGAAANPGSETQVVPGPPWQELLPLDARSEAAVSASWRPAGRDAALGKVLKKVAFKLNGSAGDGSDQSTRQQK
jgi:hypothetical protein